MLASQPFGFFGSVFFQAGPILRSLFHRGEITTISRVLQPRLLICFRSFIGGTRVSMEVIVTT